MFDIKLFTGKCVWSRYVDMFEIIPTEVTKIGDIEVPPRRNLLSLSSVTPEILERLHNFEVREDDIWIVTYPKCGTTWMQEMCWMIVNNCDYEGSQKTDLELRSPWLECSSIVPNFPFDTLDLLEKMKGPRVIKTHLSIGLLPKELWVKNPKIIHVFRDPRDAAISYYRLLLGQGMDMNIRDFLDSYITHHMYGSFWDHTLEFWKLRHQPNVLTLSYEEMKMDLRSVLELVCTFLGTGPNWEEVPRLEKHLSFESMQKNKSLNHDIESNHVASLANSQPSNFKFIRKGQVGSYKSEFPPEYISIFNDWVHSNLKNSDFVMYK